MKKRWQIRSFIKRDGRDSGSGRDTAAAAAAAATAAAAAAADCASSITMRTW